MSRALMSGFEFGDPIADGYSLVLASTGSVTPETTIVHSGSRSVKCNVGISGAGVAYIATGTNFFVLYPTIYLRCYVYVPSYPTSTTQIFYFYSPNSPRDFFWIELTPTGALNIKANTGGGADQTVATGSAGNLPTGRWVNLEIKAYVPSSGAVSVQTALRLDGVQILSGSYTNVASSFYLSAFYFGAITGGAANFIIYLDDLAVNTDTNAAYQGSWCGEGNMGIIKAYGDISVGNKWRIAGSNATTNLYTAIDNVPIIASANPTGSPPSQIEHAGGSSNHYDFAIGPYTAAGMATTDKLVAIQVIGVSSTASGGNVQLDFELTSNPVIAAVHDAPAGTASGAYPTGWDRVDSIVSDPTVLSGVTLTSGATMVVTRTNTANGNGYVAFAGALIEYKTPQLAAATLSSSGSLAATPNRLTSSAYPLSATTMLSALAQRGLSTAFPISATTASTLASAVLRSSSLLLSSSTGLSLAVQRLLTSSYALAALTNLTANSVSIFASLLSLTATSNESLQGFVDRAASLILSSVTDSSFQQSVTRTSTLALTTSSDFTALVQRIITTIFTISTDTSLNIAGGLDLQSAFGLSANTLSTLIVERIRELTFDISSSTTIDVGAAAEYISKFRVYADTNADTTAFADFVSQFTLDTTSTFDTTPAIERTSFLDLLTSTTLTTNAASLYTSSLGLLSTTEFDAVFGGIITSGIDFNTITDLLVEAARERQSALLLSNPSDLTLTAIYEAVSPLDLTGQGIFSASSVRDRAVDLPLDVSSDFVFDYERIRANAITLDSTSLADIQGALDLESAWLLSSMGTLQTYAIADYTSSLSITSTGTLSFSTSRDVLAEVILDSSGSILILPNADFASSLDISALSTVIANYVRERSISGTWSIIADFLGVSAVDYISALNLTSATDFLIGPTSDILTSSLGLIAGSSLVISPERLREILFSVDARTNIQYAASVSYASAFDLSVYTNLNFTSGGIKLGDITLDASGSIAFVPSLTLGDSLSLLGNTSLTVPPSILRSTGFTPSAQTGLQSTPTVDFVGGLNLVGQGALQMAPERIYSLSAAFLSASGVTILGNLLLASSVPLNASGAISASGQRILGTNLPMNAASDFSLVAGRDRVVAFNISATGDVLLVGARDLAVAFTLLSAGDMSVIPFVVQFIPNIEYFFRMYGDKPYYKEIESQLKMLTYGGLNFFIPVEAEKKFNQYGDKPFYIPVLRHDD